MKNSLVIYDSVFGNTEKIAQAIAYAKSDSEMFDLRKIGEISLEDLKEVKTIIVGSPTRQFNATGAINQWLKQLPKGSLQGVKFGAFDTRMTLEEINKNKFLSFMVKLFGYAAEKIARTLKKSGGIEVISPEGFYVKEVEGPLLDGELERATNWALRIIHSN